MAGFFVASLEQAGNAGESFFMNEIVRLFVSCACCRNLLTAGKVRAERVLAVVNQKVACWKMKYFDFK